MQIGIINSNQNNNSNYTDRQRVNFKGEVAFTNEQFAKKTKEIAQSLVKDRTDAVSAAEKKGILEQASNIIKKKFETIRDTYSPVVKLELGEPAVFYDNLIDVISSSRNCYFDMRNVEGYYHRTNYVTLKGKDVYWDSTDLDNLNVRNQIETGFINNLIIDFEMYNKKKQYIPMSQIGLTDYEFWGDTEVAINDESHLDKRISALKKIDIKDELILEKVKLLEKTNSWFKEHPEFLTNEIEDKLKQAYAVRPAIEAKLTHDANMDFDEFNVSTDELDGFFVSAEDMLPIDSVVCTFKDINNYLMEHMAELGGGKIFNKPVTKDGESLLMALAHVKPDKDNIDSYIKLVKSMLKMPFIDYNQKDAMGIPFIAHVLNSQNKVLFAAVTGCKDLKYDPSLEFEFNNITDPEFKELVLKTPIFENAQNKEFKTIFGKTNPMYENK